MTEQQAWDKLASAVGALEDLVDRLHLREGKVVPKDIWDAAHAADKARIKWASIALPATPRAIRKASREGYGPDFLDRVESIDVVVLRSVVRDLMMANAINAAVRSAGL